jgi:hypothetical protein
MGVNKYIKGIGSDDTTPLNAATILTRIKEIQVELIVTTALDKTQKQNLPDALLQKCDDFIGGRCTFDNLVNEIPDLKTDEARALREKNSFLLDIIKESGAFPINVREIFDEIDEEERGGKKKDDSYVFDKLAPGATQNAVRRKAVKILLSEFQRIFGVQLGEDEQKKIQNFVNSGMKTAGFPVSLHDFLTNEDSEIWRIVPEDMKTPRNINAFNGVRDKLNEEQKKFGEDRVKAREENRIFTTRTLGRNIPLEMIAEALKYPTNYLSAITLSLSLLGPAGYLLGLFVITQLITIPPKGSVFKREKKKKNTFRGMDLDIVTPFERQEPTPPAPSPDQPAPPPAPQQDRPPVPPVQQEQPVPPPIRPDDAPINFGGEQPGGEQPGGEQQVPNPTEIQPVQDGTRIPGPTMEQAPHETGIPDSTTTLVGRDARDDGLLVPDPTEEQPVLDETGIPDPTEPLLRQPAIREIGIPDPTEPLVGQPALGGSIVPDHSHPVGRIRS